MKFFCSILLFGIFISLSLSADVCPPGQCQDPYSKPVPNACTDWAFFSLNVVNYGPQGGPPILNCDVCKYVNNGLYACQTCKDGGSFLPNQEPVASGPYGSEKFQCSAPGCAVTNCKTCLTNPAGCDECDKGFFLLNGAQPICKPCPVRCAACSSSSKFTECKPLTP